MTLQILSDRLPLTVCYLLHVVSGEESAGKGHGWGLLKARSQHTKVVERERNQTLWQGKQKLHVPTCQKWRGCSLQLSGYLIWKALPAKFEHSSERPVLVCPDSYEQPPATATDRHKEQRLKSQTQSSCPFFFCCLLKKWKRKSLVTDNLSFCVCVPLNNL